MNKNLCIRLKMRPRTLRWFNVRLDLETANIFKGVPITFLINDQDFLEKGFDKMSDNAFFAELQTEFLNEAAFLLESYEESMLGLENGDDPHSYLTQIFRVAHSVKGGAAAVGLADLSKFGHVVEDLLDLLRSNPQHVNSSIISLLLQSGDELKNRIASLQKGEDGPWDTSALVAQLVAFSESLSGKPSKHHNEPIREVEAVAAASLPPPPAPDDFFSNIDAAAAQVADEAVSVIKASPEAMALGQIDSAPLPVKVGDHNVTTPSEGDDVMNLELMEELLSQLPPEEAAEFRRQNNLPPAGEAPASVAAPSSVDDDAVMSLGSAPVEELLSAPALKLVPELEETKVDESVFQASGEQPAAVASPTIEPVKPTPAAVATPAPEKPKVVPASSGGGGSSPAKGPTVAKKETSTIKVDTGRVDSVLDAVGELVVLKNQLVHDETVRNSGNLRLEAIVDQLDKSVRELYEKTLSIRMTPLKSLFIKIQRIVRDVSLSLDKPVDLQLMGEETEVERTVFELLNDPLVHLVRNAMDHGVEKRETRKERGKPETAKVTVSAKQSGGNVIIDIVDDGGGINREKVLAKAIERGLVPSNVDPASIPDETVFQYIFMPGFSTAEKISDLSGRGVGLDVVKSNLDRINGKMNIMSKLGVGTTFRMTIPLSTAITDGIVVAMDGTRYILPIHSIREIVRVTPKDYTEISGSGKVANVRGALLPVINIERVLGELKSAAEAADPSVQQKRSDTLAARREETMLVILESMTGQMAMPVDDVLGQAQVVVKPISAGATIPEVAGAAILGDGRTVLILDPGAIVAGIAKGVAA